jgi:hypothetical protein
MLPANPQSEVIRSVRLLGAGASLICSSAYQPTNLNGFELPLLSIYQPVAKALQTSALRRVTPPAALAPPGPGPDAGRGRSAASTRND